MNSPSPCREGIQAEIQSQIATQVKQEFAVQIEEHMPDGLLQKQSKETQKQLEHVKNAVNNSYVSHSYFSKICVSKVSELT